MKLLLGALLALACAGQAVAAYDEEGLSEAVISTDTAKNGNGEEEETQPFVQESDEDLADFVMDYIRRDVALKGSFLVEDPASKQVLRLTLISADGAAKNAEGGEKAVSALFRDAAGRKYTLAFYLQAGPWGGLDIYKLTLKAEKAAPAEKAKNKK